jgi:hypothetical protein
VAGPLSSQRPGADAYTTSSKGTWGEMQKDAIGVYRGKSQTRTEPNGGNVGVATPRPSSMSTTPRASVRPKAVSKAKRRRK